MQETGWVGPASKSSWAGLINNEMSKETYLFGFIIPINKDPAGGLL